MTGFVIAGLTHVIAGMTHVIAGLTRNLIARRESFCRQKFRARIGSKTM